VRPRARLLAVLLPAALAAGLVACGKGSPLPTGDLRVVLNVASADGALPADGFSLLSKDGVRAHLIRKPTPGARPEAGAEYVARGADGTYRLETPPDYGVIGEPEHAYRRGLEPMTMVVGRRFTLYVVPKEGWRVLDALVLPERTASDAETDVEAKRDRGEDGRLAVRMDEATWKTGPFHVTALVEEKSGGPGGRFSTTVRGAVDVRGAPSALLVEPASVVPLALRIALAPGGGPGAGTKTEATVWFGRLLAKQTATAGPDGVARLDQLPAPSRGVVTRVSIDGALYDVSSAREAEEARLVVAGPGALEAQGAYELSEGSGPAEVLGFVPGAGWGRIPWTETKEDAGVRLRFRSPGVTRWFVRRGDRGGFDGDGAPGSRPARGPLALPALCRVQVVIEGVSARKPCDLVATRRDGTAWTTGDGWTLRRRMRAEAEYLLPVGEWRIEAVGADGRAGPPTTVNLASPGTQSSVRVQAP
jgi:hypothetical protein